MSSTVQLIIFLVAIVVTVLVGLKTKTNIGIVGITVAFLVGMIVMNQSPFAVISNFPATLMVNMILITFFYGFASENGALAGNLQRAQDPRPAAHRPVRCDRPGRHPGRRRHGDPRVHEPHRL